MMTFDVIVVGGGVSGGLPAAAYLQKAGLDVAVVEARPELGNFCPTHETSARLRSCSARRIPMARTA
jgi:phytoene dehydrogenase-like protein